MLLFILRHSLLIMIKHSFICALFFSVLFSLESCISSDNSPTVVVIGGGLMGSSAAWQLAKRGEQVFLLEKQDSIYNNGSSLGEARIARSNNRGNDRWSYLHNETVAEVESLIEFLKANDPENEYDIADIYRTSPVTYVGRIQIYDQLLSSLKRQHVTYRMATNPKEGKRMFGVNLPDSVLLQREYNLHSGTINPQKLISYLHRAIRLSGGRVLYNHEVAQIEADVNGYSINLINRSTNIKNQIIAPKIVSAAGPYTGQLLDSIAPYFNDLILPERVFLAFYRIKHEKYDSLTEDEQRQLRDGYPVINSSKGTRMGSFFSMIEYYDENDTPVIKIGGHFQRSPIDDLDAVWNRKLTEDEKHWSFDNTLNYLQLLDLPIESEDIIFDHGYSCVYSLTENEIPLITPIRKENNEPDSSFVVMGGMSGVGAKGCLAYGRFAAKTLLGIQSVDTIEAKIRVEMGIDRIPMVE